MPMQKETWGAQGRRHESSVDASTPIKLFSEVTKVAGTHLTEWHHLEVTCNDATNGLYVYWQTAGAAAPTAAVVAAHFNRSIAALGVSEIAYCPAPGGSMNLDFYVLSTTGTVLFTAVELGG